MKADCVWGERADGINLSPLSILRERRDGGAAATPGKPAAPKAVRSEVLPFCSVWALPGQPGTLSSAPLQYPPPAPVVPRGQQPERAPPSQVLSASGRVLLMRS